MGQLGQHSIATQSLVESKGVIAKQEAMRTKKFFVFLLFSHDVHDNKGLTPDHRLFSHDVYEKQAS